jgi:hypothetical protein
MFCPRCAKKFEADTSYCRTCGLSLDEVRQILNGGADTEPEYRRRPNFSLMRAGIAIFILGMVVALGNAALSTAIGFSPDIGKVIFLSMIAVGMLFLGLGFVFQQKRYVTRRSNANTKSDPARTKSTSRLAAQLEEPREDFLEVEFPKDDREPVNAELPSVTEHTTRQLG